MPVIGIIESLSRHNTKNVQTQTRDVCEGTLITQVAAVNRCLMRDFVWLVFDISAEKDLQKFYLAVIMEGLQEMEIWYIICREFSF